ncbi:hypothetical protein FACS189450_10150 [Spirochaetia bacterium]|nr:hypothetical protein FACS189450_10150 [Spirochaetia bacterium]
MPKISIIVPVFNVEKYLRRCLDSILIQTFTDYECILVDDGSPDGCPVICDEYAEKDKRIVVIHQNNAGTVLARNAGIQKAESELLVFVDSDDWLEIDALELLYNKQKESNADIVLGGIRDVYYHGCKIFFLPDIKDMAPSVYSLLNRCGYLWGKIYKKELFTSCIFPNRDIIFGEDVIISLQIFSKVKSEKIESLDKIIYNYDRRTNGIALQINRETHYRSYFEYPKIKYVLWMENYIEGLRNNNDLKSALIAKKLIILSDYLRYNTKIKTSEITYFYRDIYKKCIYRNYIPVFRRIIFPMFYYCFPLGRCYVYMINFLRKIIIDIQFPFNSPEKDMRYETHNHLRNI